MIRTPGYDVHGSIGLTVEHNEPIGLQVNRDGGAYLSIGDAIEIRLATTHVTSLRLQAAAVLTELINLEAAGDMAVCAREVDTESATSVGRARQCADRAEAGGAVEQARLAREAADRADAATERLREAVTTLDQVLADAEQALEDVGEAAKKADLAAGVDAAAPRLNT